MKLMIAGEPVRPYERCGVYMGTDRGWPAPVPHLGRDARVNQLWDWYVGYEGDCPPASPDNRALAKELLQEYGKLDMFYQLLELAPDAAALEEGRFIGYDVSFRGVGDSLLSWGLTFHRRVGDEDEGIPRAITLLVERYFQPRVNECGLFDDRDTAVFFLEVARAMDRIEPGYLESRLDEYQVVAIGVVAESVETGSKPCSGATSGSEADRDEAPGRR